jgi:hypothetical protein
MRSRIHDAYALRSPALSYSPGDSVCRITMTSRGTRILGPDLGREIDCDMIPLLRPKSGSSTDFRLRQLRGTNGYGLFKQLGQGYGGVDFVSYLGHKIQIYQKWTHWVKASTDAKRKMMIPTTFEAVERFERNFSILFADLASVETHLGGYRIEITALGKTVRDAIQSIPSAQFDLNHWTRFGLFEQLLVEPSTILQACNHAKSQIAQKGYLNRRDSVKLTVEQKAVFVVEKLIKNDED